MTRPFIYTRTKNHDYRVLTLKHLHDLPSSFVEECLSIARAAIDASDTQLLSPSWFLVKTNETILWGIACRNSILGSPSKDKESRPVRGFFGIILSTDSNTLPYNLPFFKELYKTYVTPIWETAISNEEISISLDIQFGNIQLSTSRKESEVNFSATTSKFFPWIKNHGNYISTVFAAKDNNSIATNIHKHDQVLNIGKRCFSFLNVIMSEDSGQSRIENFAIKTQSFRNNTNMQIMHNDDDTYDKKEQPHENDNIYDEKSLFLSDKNAIDSSEKRMSLRKILNYGLYGFGGVLCLIFLFEGNDIWKLLLSDKNTTIEVVEKKFNKSDNDSKIDSGVQRQLNGSSDLNIIQSKNDSSFKDSTIQSNERNINVSITENEVI